MMAFPAIRASIFDETSAGVNRLSLHDYNSGSGVGQQELRRILRKIEMNGAAN